MEEKTETNFFCPITLSCFYDSGDEHCVYELWLQIRPLTVLTSPRLAEQKLGIHVLHGMAHRRDFLMIMVVGRRGDEDNDRKTGIYSLIRI
jgi:hypothetical protein